MEQRTYVDIDFDKFCSKCKRLMLPEDINVCELCRNITDDYTKPYYFSEMSDS